ncbi:MAG: hypothetical protein V3W37_02385 [Candidatus Binatia bacterium]
MKYRCKTHGHTTKANWRYCQRKRKKVLQRIEAFEKLAELSERDAQSRVAAAEAHLKEMQDIHGKIRFVVTELRRQI